MPGRAEPAPPCSDLEALSTSGQSNALRAPWEMALKTIFVLQVGVAALANVILLFHNVSPILLGQNQKPTHMILSHLALANLLVLFSAGIPHMVAAFVLRKPLSSLGCKLVCFIRLLAHSTSLCSTCVLSTYQLVTLIPRTVEWMVLRGRAPKFVGPSCCTCWMISVLMNVYIPVTVTGPQKTGNDTDTQGDWFCSSSSPSAGAVILWSFPDAMFIGLMIWCSGSMVLLLHRHHQRVQYIHTPTGHHRCPPETRAAHTILLLVVIFVIFYVPSSVFTFYMAAFLDSRLWLMQTSDVLVSCFPTVSPFLLLLRDPRPPRFWSFVVRDHG